MLTLRKPTTETFSSISIGIRFVWEGVQKCLHVYEKKDDEGAYAVDVTTLHVAEMPIGGDTIVCPINIDYVEVTASRV